MRAGLFSTYSTPENRVTAAVLSVFQSLSLDRTQRLIGALLEDAAFELLRFTNQIARGGEGVPDGEISSSVRILIETKIKPNSVGREQLARHLRRLDSSQETIRYLLVLTPDTACPEVVAAFDDRRVVWSSFASLTQAIDSLLADEREVVSEREAFLLRELQVLLENERLVGSPKDVVIVAARTAWREYQRHSAYICQADRSFRSVGYMGFYTHGAIQPLVPKVLDVEEHVTIGNYPEKYSALFEGVLADPENTREVGQTYKVLLLSRPDSLETIRLSAPITNDLSAKTGRGTAFTQGQRYVSLDRLKVAKTTSELIDQS